MQLPTPPPPGDATLAWVAEHLGDLALEGPEGVRRGGHAGGQTAADAALAGLDVSGYARHLHARTGRALGRSLKHEQPRVGSWPEPWPAEMACMEAVVGELEGDGWLVNQTRMWLASQCAVRAGSDWREGEDLMFRHLLDGSRAANWLGWQWTVGTGNGRPYGFSRWQVEKRAKALCRSCLLSSACPIEDWPETPQLPRVDGPDLGKGGFDGGPAEVQGGGAEQVWLTAESLGDADPALAADPDRPVVFVLDEPLLRTLRLSGKRLVFLADTLGDLATRREVEVRRGAVAEELAGRSLAVTHAPVPGVRTRAATVRPQEVHLWPWLVRPRPRRSRASPPGAAPPAPRHPRATRGAGAAEPAGGPQISRQWTARWPSWRPSSERRSSCSTFRSTSSSRSSSVPTSGKKTSNGSRSGRTSVASPSFV